MNKICAYNGWDPLKEVWLGDVWPEHFYDDLKPEIRDAFRTITRWTKEDLNIIEKFLQEYGITVRRPYINDDPSVHKFYTKDLTQLAKPPITIRDSTATIGDTLYISANDSVVSCYQSENYEHYPWMQIINEYRDRGQNVVFATDTMSTANIVRLGKDIIFDTYLPKAEHLIHKQNLDIFDRALIKNAFNSFKNTGDMFVNDYRVWWTINGGHTDGCFAVPKPGLVIGNNYWPHYEETFPGWHKLILNKPEFQDHATDLPLHTMQKWYVPNLSAGFGFNDFIINYAPKWIGNYRETFFRINMLVLDPKNVLVLGYNEAIFEELDKHGITAHVCPFRCRTFWDGGLHCITADISRESTKQDYFPDRGKNTYYFAGKFVL